MENIKDDILEIIKDVNDTKELYDIRVKYLGKKGVISELLADLGKMSIEEKKVKGPIINSLKQEVTKIFDDKNREIELKILNDKLKNEKIDISLPSTKVISGAPNILEKLVEEVEEILMSMGYDVVDGPEVEEDKFNFEM